MRCLFLLAFSACVDTAETDEPIDEADVAKADTAGAYRHYLLAIDPDHPDYRLLSRANGSTLRCPETGEVAEHCSITEQDLQLTTHDALDVVIDELEDHPIIARGRMVRTTDGRIYLRASALTRGITSVVPTGLCYRISASGQLAKLDSSVVEKSQALEFDYVDPTPDFWGQPTPAVQAKIDAGLALAATRPVYTCGDMDRRDTGNLFWAQQLFVPN